MNELICHAYLCTPVGSVLSVVTRLGAVVLFTPTFLLPALGVAAFGAWLGQVYMKAQLSVKREMSTAKAPVMAILGSAIAGLRVLPSFFVKARFRLGCFSFDSSLQRAESIQERDSNTY